MVYARNREIDVQRWKGLKGCYVGKVGSEGAMSDVEMGSEFINYLTFLMKLFLAEGF